MESQILQRHRARRLQIGRIWVRTHGLCNQRSSAAQAGLGRIGQRDVRDRGAGGLQQGSGRGTSLHAKKNGSEAPFPDEFRSGGSISMRNSPEDAAAGFL